MMRLMASPLPEAREYGGMILRELQQVMPSFVSRVERPDRGGEWVSYLERRRENTEEWVSRLGLDRRGGGEAAPSVELIHVDGTEEDLLASCLFESAGAPETEILARLDVLDRSERAELLGAMVGERANRRHRPGRGFEALRYRFEIVSDYGAFRDLQRHRMLTCQWQRLGPDLGAGVPDEVEEAGARRRVRAGARDLAQRVRAAGRRRPCRAAPYALSLAYRIRYTLDLNAREAMHLIELRSGREGHPTYRAVAQAMHERIAAIHPAVAAAMSHVDTSQEPRLERIMSEIRTQRKRAGRQAGRRRGASRPQPSRLVRCAQSRCLRLRRWSALARGCRLVARAGSRSGRLAAPRGPRVRPPPSHPGVGQGSLRRLPRPAGGRRGPSRRAAGRGRGTRSG